VRARFRSVLPPLLACALVAVIAVSGADRAGRREANDAMLFTRSATPERVHGEGAPALAAPRPMQIVIVAQRGDCSGNLSFAAFLTRTRLRPHVVVGHVLIEGSAADTLGLRPTLPRALQRVPLALLRPRERDALRALGHEATPVFLLLDPQRRLLAAIPADPDPVHRTAALRAIAHLAMHDPQS
jgi:hypothetical protein